MSSDIPLHKFSPSITGVSFPFGVSEYHHPDTRYPKPHRHDFFEIHYLTAGKGHHYIDFEAYDIEPFSLYFISPGQVHFWDLEEIIEGRALIFTEDFLTLGSDRDNLVNALSFFHCISSTPELKLTMTKQDYLADLLGHILYEFEQPRLSQASVLRAYLHIFLVEAQRHYEPLQSDQVLSNVSQARKFKQLISTHFIHERKVGFYADQMHVSTTHLHNIVKETTGQTPGQLIRSEVILEAKRLLTHTTLSAAEVGYQLEFDDPGYFNRFFKREAGLTPAQFQTRSLEKYNFC
ncbi:MAG: helix-turn-helix transcriptional regulator [Deinococcota bacterium]